jgi:hypothetical protein
MRKEDDESKESEGEEVVHEKKVTEGRDKAEG